MQSMSRILSASALGASLLVAACTSQTSLGTDPVAPGYVTGGGEWNTGGGISAVARVFERDGATVVCGVWSTDRQAVQTINLNENVMAAGSVYIGKTRLVRGLGFMPRVEYANNITGSQANCVATSVAWQPEFADAEPTLRFPRMAFADGQNGGFFQSGDALIFRQTPRPSIAL